MLYKCCCKMKMLSFVTIMCVRHFIPFRYMYKLDPLEVAQAGVQK